MHSVVAIGPERYNQLYAKFGNLNRLLAWGHARVIENLLEIRPDCPRALSDQFANPALIKRALLEKGRGIQLDQRTKAESDVAVAAASILAREAFIDWLRTKGRELQVELPRGASALVKQVGRDLVAEHGPEVLGARRQDAFQDRQRAGAGAVSAASGGRVDGRKTLRFSEKSRKNVQISPIVFLPRRHETR